MSSDSVIQKTGLGHNINAGENAVVSVCELNITSLSSNDLVTYTKQFLKFITYRDWKTADTYLLSLKLVSSLDEECKCLLELLEYKLNLLQGRDTNINQDLFIDLLLSPRSCAVIKDVVESIFILHQSITSESDARLRYNNSSHKSSFTEDVFYEKLANREELAQRLEIGISDVYEYELCSLVRCAIRCKDFQLAVELSRGLTKQYSNENSEILLSLSLTYQLYKDIDGCHYWLINNELMRELETSINDLFALVKRSSDCRLVHVAAILLSATRFSSFDLIYICSENIEEAEKAVPQIRDFLPTKIEGIDNRNSAKELLKQGELTLCESEFIDVSFSFFEGSITDRQVRKWLDNGGSVSASNDHTKEFIQIALLSIACNPKDGKQKIRLSEQLEAFLRIYLNKISEFNIQIIQQLCVNLKRVDLPLYVVQLLEPILPNKPWASPVLDIYAEALLASDQLEKLELLLKKMEGVDDSFHLLAVKIESACLSNDFVKAIALTEHALTKYQNSCYYWFLLLHNLYRSDSPTPEIVSAISRIPKELLNNYSEEGLRLLDLIAQTDLSLAESLILEWFIDDPVGMAIHVTNLHFNSLARAQIPAEISYPSDRCSHAVVYTSGKRQYTKLLVDNCRPSEYLLDTDSPLGQQLLKELDVEEEPEQGMATSTVVEKLSPIVGAFRISTNIRNDINQGYDCFNLFSIEEDDVESILEHIDSISKKKQVIDSEIDGKSIPLLMRLNHTHQSNLVRGAFSYLCDKESNKSFNLFAVGEVIEQSVVLDILSLAYFCLTGLSQGLMQTGIKVYITKETHSIASDLLEEMCRPDYLSIANIDGCLIKTTAEDVARDSSINNLRTLLKNCELLSPASIDMPEVLTKIRDVLDISHYSSLKVSISHSIPFLCLDSEFCSFYSQLDVTLANAYQLMVDANLANSTNEISRAECHVQFGLPVPLMHKDVIELCRQKDKGQYLAARTLQMYPNSFPSSETALHVLTNCCLMSIRSAYLGVNVQLNLSKWRYTEHIVYACCESAMMCLKGDTCEQRLALLILNILEPLKSMDDITRFSLDLFRRFVRGHFLDARQIDEELQVMREKWDATL